MPSDAFAGVSIGEAVLVQAGVPTVLHPNSCQRQPKETPPLFLSLGIFKVGGSLA